MKELTSVEDFPATVIHGTYTEPWNQIKTKGLSVMRRNHIHLASGKFGQEGVISGMRKTADVFIYIDIPKALQEDIKFFISENGVILTPGNSQGLLPPHLFLKVEDKKGNNLLL
ncbi:hypothetical protein TRICI_002023 [Trichomonascus ciferrii]|uniref:2'-phosphotransferase n=1 Tax=Trichomonascus ciferrii TaxID=44093 RepID=A0A642V7R9_9ASCO|nr:hypothetical protein TRICI_002023 [Trichomonascus ciferrii]